MSKVDAYIRNNSLPRWLVKQEAAAGKSTAEIYREHLPARSATSVEKRKQKVKAVTKKKPTPAKPAKPAKTTRTKVCAFRMTDKEFAAVEAALAKVGLGYSPADFYRAAALALIEDSRPSNKSLDTVKDWLEEAGK